MEMQGREMLRFIALLCDVGVVVACIGWVRAGAGSRRFGGRRYSQKCWCGANDQRCKRVRMIPTRFS